MNVQRAVAGRVQGSDYWHIETTEIHGSSSRCTISHLNFTALLYKFYVNMGCYHAPLTRVVLKGFRICCAEPHSCKKVTSFSKGEAGETLMIC